MRKSSSIRGKEEVIYVGMVSLALSGIQSMYSLMTNLALLLALTQPCSYLGDALVHCSFLPLLYSASLLHPLTIAGPLANYIFLRFIGGDKENETNQEARYKTDNKTKYEQLQEWKVEKNSFWPRVEEITNPWTLVVLGCGIVGALAEVGVRSYYMPRGL